MLSIFKKGLEFGLGLAPVSVENLHLAIIFEVIFTAVLVFGALKQKSLDFDDGQV